MKYRKPGFTRLFFAKLKLNYLISLVDTPRVSRTKALSILSVADVKPYG
jgi:hypothetical protein